jgi:hypothetical protein
MGSGGLLALISYGTQNVILNGNPKMTYFYKVFKSYSHFSMENITVAFNSQNDITFDNPVSLRLKIPRNGDLMSEMIFSFTLPDIYSKYVDSRAYQYEFQWTRCIGAAIIQSVQFNIGGQKIQEFDGTYIMTRAYTDMDSDSLDKWSYLVGDTPEMTDPLNGRYAGQLYYQGQLFPAYPTVKSSSPANITVLEYNTGAITLTRASGAVPVVGYSVSGPGIPNNAIIVSVSPYNRFTGPIDYNPDSANTNLTTFTISAPVTTTTTIQTALRITSPQPIASRPSIVGRDIHVPLPFWFTEATSNAVPLVGLQNQECEVVLTLNPISQLYNIQDTSGNRVNPTKTTAVIGEDTDNILAGNPTYNDSIVDITNFLTDFGTTPPTFTSIYINPRVQITYIYLPKEEQEIFATRPLSYIVPQVTPILLSNIVSRNTYDLDIHLAITRLLFAQRRSDWIYRNDFANFTNWSTWPIAPFRFIPTMLRNSNGDPAFSSSGLLVTGGQQDIIRNIRILCNGNELQELKTVDFFTRYSPYRYTAGKGMPGLAVYSFELSHSPTQPSGSINASYIRKFQVDIDVWPLPPNFNYLYEVTVYAENLNFLEVVSGMGGLKYAT